MTAHAADFRSLAALLRGRSSLVAITGAGISTDSGIPDYRSPGRPAVKSIKYNEFVGSHAARQRYWSRSLVGYSVLAKAKPNKSHYVLKQAQDQGQLQQIITQNVDGLHQVAGSSQVICLDCGHRTHRETLQERLLANNPAFRELMTGGTTADDASALLGRDQARRAHTGSRPDGDTELSPGTEFNFCVPKCLSCGGMLKPDVCFFGENLPPDRRQLSINFALGADALLVTGTSLAVWSAYGLVKRAVAQGTPVFIVTRGPTRADDLIPASHKFELSAAEMLPALLGSTPAST